MPDQPPTCSLCGEPCEPWPTGGDEPPHGYGHNPEPLGRYDERCCDLCNRTKVIPARIDNMMKRKRN